MGAIASTSKDNNQRFKDTQALMSSPHPQLSLELLNLRLSAPSSTPLREIVPISAPAKPSPPPKPSAKPTPPFPFTALPDELKILVLQHALHVHRVTPMYAHMFRDKSLIRRLTLVSKQVCGIAKEVYYGENLVVIERRLFLPVCLHPIKPTPALTKVPSTEIAPWIRRLEMRITIRARHWWEHTDDSLRGEGPLDLQMRRDLGVLLRRKDEVSGRTSWQTGLTALRELRVVFSFRGSTACDLNKMFRDLEDRMVIDLRPERVEVKVDGTVGEACSCRYRCRGEDVLSEGDLAGVIGGMVRLRGRGT